MIGEGQQKDGPKYHLRSRATDGLVKTNGKWRIVHEHLSMAIPRDKFADVLKNSPAPGK
jgi:ketosteroid isomerase-like protein